MSIQPQAKSSLLPTSSKLLRPRLLAVWQWLHLNFGLGLAGLQNSNNLLHPMTCLILSDAVSIRCARSACLYNSLSSYSINNRSVFSSLFSLFIHTAALFTSIPLIHFTHLLKTLLFQYFYQKHLQNEILRRTHRNFRSPCHCCTHRNPAKTCRCSWYQDL
jgi:hypothetical protein